MQCTRLGPRCRSTMFLFLLAFLALAAGCGSGGGSGGSSSTAPPAPDFINGPTMNSISSYWSFNPCMGGSGRFAFAADGTGAFTGTGLAGQYQPFTWTRPSPTTVLLVYAQPCSICLGQIRDMSGGVGSGELRGDGVRVDGFNPAGICVFNLVGGPLP